MLESSVESDMIRRVHKAGGMVTKLVPVKAGAPDRLVILPGGKIRLVELKSESGRLRPIQEAWHRKAAKRGVIVPVLSSTAEVKEWLAKELRS